MMADNCFMAHEIINHVKKRKKGGRFEGVLKVDLSKAYDRVKWDFLIKILRSMEFPEVWINWIHQCISTVTYSILVNGEPSDTITPKRGLRQGDPLSPYLFIILMEVLTRGIRNMEESGQVQGIKVIRVAPPISHLFFVDDALFFFKATPTLCRAIRDCIDGFCSVSINFGRFVVLFSPNTPSRFVRLMRKPLGVKSKDHMSTYLGCPMDVDGRSSSKFNVILENLNSKISSWKFSNLSASGKLILINGVLVALESHMLSIYMCPSLTLKKTTSTLLRFWWSSSSSTQSKPIYWKKKEVLLAHKAEGGLGIRDVGALNKSLLARQCWRMYKKPNLLVSRVFRGKYGNDPLSMGYEGKMPRNCSWSARSLIKASMAVKQGIRLRIGNGQAARITEDVWVGGNHCPFPACN